MTHPGKINVTSLVGVGKTARWYAESACRYGQIAQMDGRVGLRGSSQAPLSCCAARMLSTAPNSFGWRGSTSAARSAEIALGMAKCGREFWNSKIWPPWRYGTSYSSTAVDLSM
jgi:hypothetical protein